MSSPLLRYLLKKNTTQITRNRFKLDLPRFKYAIFKRSFCYHAAIIWNGLSNQLRESSTYEAFKKALTKSDIIDKISFGCNATGKARDHLNYVYY